MASFAAEGSREVPTTLSLVFCSRCWAKARPMPLCGSAIALAVMRAPAAALDDGERGHSQAIGATWRQWAGAGSPAERATIASQILWRSTRSISLYTTEQRPDGDDRGIGGLGIVIALVRRHHAPDQAILLRIRVLGQPAHIFRLGPAVVTCGQRYGRAEKRLVKEDDRRHARRVDGIDQLGVVDEEQRSRRSVRAPCRRRRTETRARS